VGLDLGLCLQRHTKWVGDFSTLVDVYNDGNRVKYATLEGSSMKDLGVGRAVKYKPKMKDHMATE
jgi:hypothetical protein